MSASLCVRYRTVQVQLPYGLTQYDIIPCYLKQNSVGTYVNISAKTMYNNFENIFRGYRTIIHEKIIAQKSHATVPLNI